MPVCYETFQTADTDCFTLNGMNALALALVFLRADTTADGRQGTGFTDNLISRFEVSFCNFRDKIRNLDHNRAAGHARSLAALQAPHGFPDSHFLGVSGAHFEEVFISYVRSLFRHRVLFSY